MQSCPCSSDKIHVQSFFPLRCVSVFTWGSCDNPDSLISCGRVTLCCKKDSFCSFKCLRAQVSVCLQERALSVCAEPASPDESHLHLHFRGGLTQGRTHFQEQPEAGSTLYFLKKSKQRTTYCFNIISICTLTWIILFKKYTVCAVVVKVLDFITHVKYRYSRSRATLIKVKYSQWHSVNWNGLQNE